MYFVCLMKVEDDHPMKGGNGLNVTHQQVLTANVNINKNDVGAKYKRSNNKV
jgi:hypothetical protein